MVEAFNETRQLDPEDRTGNWSLGVAYHWQDSLYAGEGYRLDFMPTFIYTGERFFIDTTDFGWHALDDERWQLDLYASYFIAGYNDHTFFSETGEVREEDDPLKGMERKNAFEGALELTRKTPWGRFAVELRHDVNGVHNGSEVRGHWARVYRHERWQLEPWVELRWLSQEKADYYFGVRDPEATDNRDPYRLDNTGSWAAGTALRYAFWDQHRLALNVAYREFGGDISGSPVIDNRRSASVQLTYRYELNGLRSPGEEGAYNFFANNANPYSLRIAYGCTTETKFNEILRGGIDCSPIDTGLASLFVGRKVAKEIFRLPIEGWVQAGIARRFENDLQDDFFEAVFAFKAIYRRFPWSDRVETRIGLGQGLSYADRVPALEKQKGREKNRRTSHLLNYLDFSVDVSVGDILRRRSMKKLFLGFGVHHRSGVFASADLFGNTYGGSNVNTLYLEWEFDASRNRRRR